MSSRQGLRCMIINCSKNNRERKDLLTCCKFKDNRYTRYIHYIYKTIIFYVLARFLHKTWEKYFFWHTYCQYCQLGFSSEIEVPQLGSARNLHSSARLELENSGSGSSLLISMIKCLYFFELASLKQFRCFFVGLIFQHFPVEVLSLVMSPSRNFPARAEPSYEGSEPSRAGALPYPS